MSTVYRVAFLRSYSASNQFDCFDFITSSPKRTMCQLLGMNCATPTDFSFSFRGFCQRGGSTDIHAHGWGLAIYEGRGLRTFLDTLPACTSPVAKLVSQYPMKTYNMMAHVRYATQGEVSLENVHPFSREMVRRPVCQDL